MPSLVTKFPSSNRPVHPFLSSWYPTNSHLRWARFELSLLFPILNHCAYLIYRYKSGQGNIGELYRPRSFTLSIIPINGSIFINMGFRKLLALSLLTEVIDKTVPPFLLYLIGHARILSFWNPETPTSLS